MCGIVGLHLREPSLYPRLGELLTGMLCQVTERGPDSAGVAVYGDPRWSPPGHASVSLLPGTTTPEEVATALRCEKITLIIPLRIEDLPFDVPQWPKLDDA